MFKPRCSQSSMRLCRLRNSGASLAHPGPVMQSRISSHFPERLVFDVERSSESLANEIQVTSAAIARAACPECCGQPEGGG